MSPDLTQPRMPDGLGPMVLRVVDSLWNAALALPCRDIAARGQVDDFGEPGLGVIVHWETTATPAPDPAQPLPVAGLSLSLAPDDDDPEITQRLRPFRVGHAERRKLAARIIGRLNLDHVRRLNDSRPLLALEDDELDEMSFDALRDADLSFPLATELLEKMALQVFALEELMLRLDGESAHQRFEREAAQRTRRRKAPSTAR